MHRSRGWPLWKVDQWLPISSQRSLLWIRYISYVCYSHKKQHNLYLSKNSTVFPTHNSCICHGCFPSTKLSFFWDTLYIAYIYNLKLTENEWYSTEQKMINIHIIILQPFIIPLPFLHFSLGEKGRKWKIYNLKRTENEGYSPE